MYKLYFGDAFLSSARRLDKAIQLQIKKKLNKLQKGKVKIEPLHGELVGKYKIRVGKYRIICKF